MKSTLLFSVRFYYWFSRGQPAVNFGGPAQNVIHFDIHVSMVLSVQIFGSLQGNQTIISDTFLVGIWDAPKLTCCFYYIQTWYISFATPSSGWVVNFLMAIVSFRLTPKDVTPISLKSCSVIVLNTSNSTSLSKTWKCFNVIQYSWSFKTDWLCTANSDTQYNFVPLVRGLYFLLSRTSCKSAILHCTVHLQ